jgi:hypothetical protein
MEPNFYVQIDREIALATSPGISHMQDMQEYSGIANSSLGPQTSGGM